MPTELLVVLHSLWERVKIEPEKCVCLSRTVLLAHLLHSDTFAHDIKVWAALLKLALETTPEANNRFACIFSALITRS